jgi:CheY-like chemotaxis protein
VERKKRLRRNGKANAIVVIDNDDRFLLTETFKIASAKQEIVEVSCANDFIDLIDRWYAAPNLTLVDVEMPAMNGLELMGALRQYVQLIGTRKIMLSTHPAYREWPHWQVPMTFMSNR